MLVGIRERMLEEIVDFPGRKASTRAELYRRLHYAHDYIESCFDQPLSVGKVATVACLSPYHFQRSYKQAFGISPMRAVQQRRLAEARRLLTTTDRPVGEICLDVGFGSPSSFSTLFRCRYGLAPSALRRRARN
jgi:transcriptional regulator GlxA family with amidase domain